MNTRLAIAKTLLLLVLTAFAAFPLHAEYVMHGRISYDAGGTMVKGLDDAEWSHAPINTLILPGDILWVDEGGTMELELAGGTYLRMADSSKAEITALPPDTLIKGWQGSFYVQRLNRSTGGATFETPACQIEVEKDTAVRVDIVDEGATTITVRWGRVTLRTDAGPASFVTAGERVWVDPGLLPSTPVTFDRNEEDAFDGWNRERAKLLAVGPESIPKSVVVTEPTLGVTDLVDYGEWIYIDDRPYWRPTVVVDYIPYRYGHWTYVVGAGNVWVGNYPFCYVTSHYGRWNYYASYGWVWSYDPVWSPAWVATVRCGDYFVWTPIDYYYRPVLAHASVYFSVGGVDFGIHTSSYVLADCVYWGPSYVYAVQPDIVAYVNHHHNDIHIWNINIGDRHCIPVPYDRSISRVRNYNPSRSIRGPATFGATGPTAVQRVQRLESSSRTQFTSVSRTGERGVRTAAAPDARAARVRSVRVNELTPRPGAARSAEATTAMRTRAASDPREAGRATRVGGADQTVRGATSRVGMTSTPARTMQRDSGAATRSPSAVVPNLTVPERAPARSVTTRGPSRSSIVTTRRPAPASRDAIPARTPVEGRAPRVVTRTPEVSRDTSVRTSSPVSRPAPEPRTFADSPSRSSTQGRSPRIVNSAPSRDLDSLRAPNISTTHTRSVTHSAPEPSISRSAPSISYSAPSPSISRSAPSVSRSAPFRSISHSTPSVSRSTPSVSRSAPSVSRSAPSISRSVPSHGAVRGR